MRRADSSPRLAFWVAAVLFVATVAQLAVGTFVRGHAERPGPRTLGSVVAALLVDRARQRRDVGAP